MRNFIPVFDLMWKALRRKLFNNNTKKISGEVEKRRETNGSWKQQIQFDEL